MNPESFFVYLSGFMSELRARVEYLEAENALLKKVKALVEARDAHLKGIGQKPSTN